MSHASEDRQIASRICSALEAEGIACRMASDDLKEAADYGAGILEGMRTSDLVLLVFSASANRSPYVLREIERAIAYDRPVLSLHVDDTLPNASIEYYLNLWQWLDVRQGIEGKHQEILVAVRGQLARSAAQATSSDERPLADARIPGKAELGADGETGKTRRRDRWAWWIAVAVLLVVAAGAGAGIWAATRAPHNAWTELKPCGALPGARYSPSLVYAPSTGQVVVRRSL